MDDRLTGAGSTGVELREVIEDDLLVLFAHQQDPEATAMAAFPARERDAFLAHWTKILADERVAKRTILVDGVVAGNIVSFTQEGEREVGYWIGREYWGRGVATAALRAFLDDNATRPLVAHVAEHNVASRRVLENCGFAVVGDGIPILSENGKTVREIRLRLDRAGSG